MAKESKDTAFLQLPPKEQLAVLRANSERNRQIAESADKIETADPPKKATRTSAPSEDMKRYTPPHMRVKEKQTRSASLHTSVSQSSVTAANSGRIKKIPCLLSRLTSPQQTRSQKKKKTNPAPQSQMTNPIKNRNKTAHPASKN